MIKRCILLAGKEDFNMALIISVSPQYDASFNHTKIQEIDEKLTKHNVFVMPSGITKTLENQLILRYLQ